MPLKVKRVYEAAQAEDGYRVLVDRLWPRGLTRQTAVIDAWLKECAPSADLRRWFGHDPAKWPQFQQRYFKELDAKKAVLADILTKSRAQPVTLLYAAKDAHHNNAVAMKSYLESRVMRFSN